MLARFIRWYFYGLTVEDEVITARIRAYTN